MLTATHPNALWLAGLYGGGTAIALDPTLDEETRKQKSAAHLAAFRLRMSPNLIIHTGGVRLAATGDMGFFNKYARRRAALSNSDVVPLEIDQILADDFYGVIHGRFRTARGAEIWERIGMGAWRFEDGMAVEHWELSNGPKWDAFFLAGDPDFTEGTAEEFWTK